MLRSVPRVRSQSQAFALELLDPVQTFRSILQPKRLASRFQIQRPHAELVYAFRVQIGGSRPAHGQDVDLASPAVCFRGYGLDVQP